MLLGPGINFVRKFSQKVFQPGRRIIFFFLTFYFFSPTPAGLELFENPKASHLIERNIVPKFSRSFEFWKYYRQKRKVFLGGKGWEIKLIFYEKLSPGKNWIINNIYTSPKKKNAYHMKKLRAFKLWNRWKNKMLKGVRILIIHSCTYV